MKMKMKMKQATYTHTFYYCSDCPYSGDSMTFLKSNTGTVECKKLNKTVDTDVCLTIPDECPLEDKNEIL